MELLTREFSPRESPCPDAPACTQALSTDPLARRQKTGAACFHQCFNEAHRFLISVPKIVEQNMTWSRMQKWETLSFRKK